MSVYIILLILILILGLLAIDKNYRTKPKVFLFLSFTLMILVVGLRGSTVGEDTKSYMNMFRVIQNTNWHDLFNNGISFAWTQWGESVEILFAILNKVISLFTDEAQYSLFIVALISFVLIARFIYINMPEHYFFGTIIVLCNGVFMSSFNASRQILALSIVINAYQLFEEKKYIRIGIIFLIGFLMHNSSVLLLPLFILSRTENRKKAVTITAIFALFSSSLIPLFATIVSRLFPIYSVYFQKTFWENSINGILFLWIAEIAVCCLYFFMGIDNEYELLANLAVILSIAVSIISLKVSVFSRITVYFSFFNILLFPLALEKLTARNTKIAYTCLVFALVFMQYFSAASIESRQYMFFWQ